MVSVIIVSFNTSELTLRCIEAVLGSVGVDLEIILVDNNSSDSTVKLVKRNFPNVLVVKNSKNLGFGSANNIGMAVKSEFCVQYVDK
jgi:GT2 family glycosyltransferase